MLNDIAFKVEELANDAEKVNSTQLALYSAIYEGPFDASAYVGAFMLFGEATSRLQKGLEDLTDELFHQHRENK